MIFLGLFLANYVAQDKNWPYEAHTLLQLVLAFLFTFILGVLGAAGLTLLPTSCRPERVHRAGRSRRLPGTQPGGNKRHNFAGKKPGPSVVSKGLSIAPEALP